MLRAAATAVACTVGIYALAMGMMFAPWPVLLLGLVALVAIHHTPFGA